MSVIWILFVIVGVIFGYVIGCWYGEVVVGYKVGE